MARVRPQERPFSVRQGPCACLPPAGMAAVPRAQPPSCPGPRLHRTAVIQAPSLSGWRQQLGHLAPTHSMLPASCQRPSWEPDPLASRVPQLPASVHEWTVQLRLAPFLEWLAELQLPPLAGRTCPWSPSVPTASCQALQTGGTRRRGPQDALCWELQELHQQSSSQKALQALLQQASGVSPALQMGRTGHRTPGPSWWL
mmetsp:Transcript_79443/g.219732  ORF Transcript_79443/g.219732 Transcript_79443/m.219732 type:complete len:200 (-) Transcript_79443:1101-1700(-)